MLISRTRNTHRGMTGHIEPVAPVTMVPDHRPAANADNIVKTDVLARRQRRQRSVTRNALRNVNGWTVRTW